MDLHRLQNKRSVYLKNRENIHKSYSGLRKYLQTYGYFLRIYHVRCTILFNNPTSNLCYHLRDNGAMKIFNRFLLIVGKSFLCKEVPTKRSQDDGLKQNYQRTYTS